MKLTKALIENLRHVEKFGEAKPRSASGYWCRTHGLSEWVWRLADGTTATSTEHRATEGYPFVPPGRELVKIIGERLTDAGRQALNQKDKSDE